VQLRQLDRILLIVEIFELVGVGPIGVHQQPRVAWRVPVILVMSGGVIAGLDRASCNRAEIRSCTLHMTRQVVRG